MSDFDLARLRRVFSDLAHTTRGQAPMLELRANEAGSPLIQGTANRAGLLRLGINLARAACEDSALVRIHENGVAQAHDAAGLIEIAISDTIISDSLRSDGSPLHAASDECTEKLGITRVVSIVLLALAFFGLVALVYTLLR